MVVNIGTGLVYTRGANTFQGVYAGYNDASYAVTIPASSSTQWRSDYIVARQHDSAYGDGDDNWDIVDIPGSFSSSSPGALPALSGNVTPLWIVRVTPNMTVTTATGTLVDARQYAPLAGPWPTTSANQPPTTSPDGSLWVENDTHLLGVVLNSGLQYILTSPNSTAADSWHNITGLANGWSIGSGGYFSYRFNLDRRSVKISVRNVSVGSNADGTTIFSSAIPSSYRPMTNQRVLVGTDVMRVSGGNTESSELIVITDGTIQCQGIASAATRVDIAIGEYPLDK
jgi:hypothetical protein